MPRPLHVLRFGTDGVRGVANTELTPEFALSLGRAAARVLGGSAFVVGRDTRRSGPLLSAAFCAGLMSEGIDVIDLGVLPTPGVAWVSAHLGVPAAMISASHNPYADNGIKLFSAGGRKLPDAVEESIESLLADGLGGHGPNGDGPNGRDRHGDGPNGRGANVGGPKVGTSRTAATDLVGGYANALFASIQGRSLNGLKVVVDCANGAASVIGPAVLTRLGATVIAIHDDPNGTNINDGCGSTHPSSLQAAVVAAGADAGLAFDGDADRVLAVDHTGALVDGDQLLAMNAIDLRNRGRLTHDTVVVTVMSNLGFKRAMASVGIDVIVTQVGDRYVLDAMSAGGFILGGEQSGHVIFADHATTGDGLLTGIATLDTIVRTGRPLHDHAALVTRYPQVLRSVQGVDRSRLPGAQRLWAEVAIVEAEFGEDGRVNVRPSGTEPVVRVMVEAPTAAQAEAACARLCEVVGRELG